MSSAPSDLQPQKVFTPRRRRALLSFRRRGDLVWFLTSGGLFVAGLTSLAYSVLQFRRPLVVESPAAAVPVAPDPTPHPVPPPSPAPAAPPVPVAPPTTVEPVAIEEPAVVAPPPAKKAAPERREAKKPEPVREEPAAAPRARVYELLAAGSNFKALVDRNARLSTTAVEAVGEPALRLDYDFQGGEWVQAFVNVTQDFKKFSRVQFAFNGEGGANTLEFKIVDADGSNFGATWTHRTGRSAWTVVDMPLKDLAYLWGGDSRMDWSRVRQIYVAVSKKSGDDGGKGRVVIRGVTFS